MMDQWNDGGGYFTGNDTTGSVQTNKSVTRQPFLCPVTARQVSEASDEGVKIGSRTVTMVSMVGIISNVEATSTNLKFSLSDDTGIIDCLEWIESEDEGKHKDISSVKENTYYSVFGCIKSTQGRNRVMVFKKTPIVEFNEVTAFMLEVLNANTYTEKEAKVPEQFTTTTNNDYNNYYNTFDNQTSFTPVQKKVLDAIKSVGTQVGWSKYDTELRKMFSAKQIQDALDFLVGEGHIYTTVDDDHFCST